MLDHVSVGVSELERAMGFYDAVLAALGYKRVASSKHHAAYAENEDDRTFFIQHPVDRERCTVGNGTHVCFRAHSPDEVDLFHAEGIRTGGADNGVPATRYHDNYYAAFLLDPDGNRLEAVYIG